MTSLTEIPQADLSTTNFLRLYLWFEQAAADSIPQAGSCTQGFPGSSISLFLQTAVGLIHTFLIGITLTHPFSHEPLSATRCHFYRLTATRQRKCKAVLLQRYHYFLNQLTNNSSRSVASEHTAIDDNLEDLH